MKKKFDISSFTPFGAAISDGIIRYSDKGGKLVTEDVNALKEPANFLVLDVTNKGPYSCSVLWEFWDNDEKHSSASIKMGLLPGLKTRLALPLSSAQGERLFLRRTPGKLKTVVQGHPIRLSNLKKFALTAYEAPNGVELEVHDFFVTDEEVDFPLPEKKLVDALGQKNADFVGKTHSVTELCEYLQAEAKNTVPTTPEGRSRYGGTLKKRFSPTGFFAVHKDNGRYFLADPDGYAFFSMGFDCVGVDGGCNLSGIKGLCEYLPPYSGDALSGAWERRNLPQGEDPQFLSFAKMNLMRAFGDDWYEKWTAITRRRLIDWGMNTVACWSDMRFIKNAKMPYLHILHGFPHTEKHIFRDFPDVFSAEYKRSADEWAMQLDALKDDPLMIGYFMSNEPNWGFVNNLDICAMMLEDEFPYESKRVFEVFVKEKYGDIDALNAAWGSSFSDFGELLSGIELSDKSKPDTRAFSEKMIREFVKVPSLALKEVDKNHLNLGMRYAWLSSREMAAGCEYFDVFSFNCYQTDPKESIKAIVDIVDMPVIIGEFHFGALDRGMDATGIRGVLTQKDRAEAYRSYMNSAAADPYCLGASYFILNDQPYLGRFDGENYQIGAVDVCNRPYDEFVDGLIRTHGELYDVYLGEKAPCEPDYNEVPAIFY